MNLIPDKKNNKPLIAVVLLIFLLVAVYFFLLPAKTREDKMNILFKDEKYLDLIELGNENIRFNELELSILSSAVSVVEKNINERANEERKELLESVSRYPGYKQTGSFYKINDPYFLKIKKNSIYYAKTILFKLENSIPYLPENELAFYMSELAESNPSFYPEMSANVLLQYLRKYTLLSLDNSSVDRLSHMIHYLASRSQTDFKFRFFASNGKNINTRTGPGTENSIAFKITENHTRLFVTDSESRQETIAGKTGNWKKVYDLQNHRSGWIFSPFLEKADYNVAIAEEVKQSLVSSNSLQIEFNGWNPDFAPAGFTGKYRKLETVDVTGDRGILINQGEKSDIFICRSIPRQTRLLAFQFSKMGKNPVGLFSIQMKKNRLYQIDLDIEGITINKNKYILDTQSDKVILELKFGSDWKKASLIDSGDLVLGNISPLENPGNGDPQICLQSSAAGKSAAVLYGFKIKME